MSLNSNNEMAECEELLTAALVKVGVSDASVRLRRMDKLLSFMELVLRRNEVIQPSASPLSVSVIQPSTLSMSVSVIQPSASSLSVSELQ